MLIFSSQNQDVIFSTLSFHNPLCHNIKRTIKKLRKGETNLRAFTAPFLSACFTIGFEIFPLDQILNSKVSFINSYSFSNVQSGLAC